MPINAPVIAQAIIAAGPDIVGVSWPRLATVIGIAVATWAVVPANLSMQGVTTGTLGSGTVTGKFYVVPAPLPVPAAMALATVLGVRAPSLARALGMGVAAAFNASASYTGVSAGVGTGSDVSKVVLANGPALVLALQAAAVSSGLVGVALPTLFAGVGPGIANLLLLGTGTGVVTGAGSPASGVGSSTSVVF